MFFKKKSYQYKGSICGIYHEIYCNNPAMISAEDNEKPAKITIFSMPSWNCSWLIHTKADCGCFCLCVFWRHFCCIYLICCLGECKRLCCPPNFSRPGYKMTHVHVCPVKKHENNSCLLGDCVKWSHAWTNETNSPNVIQIRHISWTWNALSCVERKSQSIVKVSSSHVTFHKGPDLQLSPRSNSVA